MCAALRSCEISPVLRQGQKVALSKSGAPIHWHAGLDEVPAGASPFAFRTFGPWA